VNILLLRWSAIAFVIGLFTLMSSGCVATGGGYGYDGGVGIGLDYYEPYGAFYGGWGPSYRVGPFRDGGHRPDRDGGHRPDRGGGHRPDRGGGQTTPHAYRSAPASHPMPSIPSRSRFGGSRSH